MGLRERLAARTRRAVRVLIAVEDTASATETVALARALLAGAVGELATARTDGTEATRVAELEENQRLAKVRLDEAEQARLALFVEVDMRALPSDDWEAAVATFPAAEDSDDLLDWVAALPVLMAESCTDPELQDEAWWAAEVASDRWTAGQRDHLRAQLMDLNLRPLEVAPNPFG